MAKDNSFSYPLLSYLVKFKSSCDVKTIALLWPSVLNKEKTAMRVNALVSQAGIEPTEF
jgi:hypothetical protein